MVAVAAIYLSICFCAAGSQAQVRTKRIEPRTYGIEKNNSRKIDPTFLHMLGKTKRQLKRSTTRTPLKVEESGNIQVSAIIKTNNIDELKAVQSVEIGSVHGNVVTAKFDFDLLPDIANLESTVGIEASKILYPLLDESVEDTKADLVWNMQTYEFPFKGENVLIGIIDTGIDWEHKDFIDNDENANQSLWESRIVALYDQKVGMSIGQPQIEEAIRNGGTLPSIDSHGHGTHVAGIAAGDGSSSDKGFIGMAPKSKLVVCKNNGNSLSSYGLDTTGALDCIDWMLNLAASLNMPLVVNQSQGNLTGPHDGSTLYEESLDQDVENNGLIYVVAAGNGRLEEKHAAFKIPAGGNHIFEIDFAGEDSLDTSKKRKIQFWYYESDEFKIRIRPDSPDSDWSASVPLNTSTVEPLAFGGEASIVHGPAEYSNSRDNVIDIDIYNLGTQFSSYNSKFFFEISDVDEVENEPIHGYIERNMNDAHFSSDVTDEGTIGPPASCKSAITVAAYNTKDNYVDLYGQLRSYQDLYPVGDTTAMSAKGPLRKEDFATKPDISAPGKAIVSSLSHSVDKSEGSTITDGTGDLFLVDENPIGEHLIRAGTSMAAPHVSGAIALLLENFPDLTGPQVKKILKDSADQVIYGKDTDYKLDWEDKKYWGAGKLDILKAYKSMAGFTYGDNLVPEDKEKFKNAFTANDANLDGLPVGEVISPWMGDASLFVQKMSNGAIFYKSGSTEAYWIGEGIWKKWLEIGGKDSEIGLPESKEFYDVGNNGYSTVLFQHGSIYWNGYQVVALIEKIRAEFVADVTSDYRPMTVEFTDLSTSENTTIVSWEWDFDYDGIVDSYERDAVHIYTVPGVYTVSLTVYDGSLTSNETKFNYVQVSDKPVAPDIDITEIEYFFDEDPGSGAGHSMPVAPSNILTASANIDLSGLSQGVHRLFIRAKDENGVWGIPQSKTIILQKTDPAGVLSDVVELECFFDDDPGFGEGAAIATVPCQEIESTGTVDLSPLPLGLHRMYVRGKDASGNWGIPQSHTFLLQESSPQAPRPELTRFEYFIDDDPGFGLGTALESVPGQEVTVTENIDLSAFSEGLHRFYVRAMEASGTWGLVQSNTFLLQKYAADAELADITGMEYFIDSDLGFGLGRSIAVSPGESVEYDGPLSLDFVPTGDHTLYARAKNTWGQWGIVQSVPFFMEPPPDTDGDFLADYIENMWCTLVQNPDSDGDGILDGVEDANQNKTVDPCETDPCDWDTDGDGIADGTEDSNQNGTFDEGETSALLVDTDGDGISDGDEDANRNGMVDEGETDPKNWDTDGDQRSDSDEKLAGSDALSDKSVPCIVCIDPVGSCEACSGVFECRESIGKGIEFAEKEQNPFTLIKVQEGTYHENISLSTYIKLMIKDGTVSLEDFLAP